MALTQRRLTFEEWMESPLNTALSELVDGIPVERMSTSWNHGQVVKALWRRLDRAEQAGYGQVALGSVGVLLDADSARNNVREPDLCFVTAARDHLITAKAVEGLPDLVIEVLSPTNRQDDLPGGDVWRSYERFGVPRYWIVDPEAQTVTQYEHRGGRFVEVARLSDGDRLTSPLFLDLTIDVGDLFGSLR